MKEKSNKRDNVKQTIDNIHKKTTDRIEAVCYVVHFKRGIFSAIRSRVSNKSKSNVSTMKVFFSD